MRVLLVHSFYRSALPSGENDVVRAQADLMESRGYQVLVWGPTSPEDASLFDKARLAIRVATGSGLDPQEVVEEFQPHLIHVHNLFPNVSTKWLSGVTSPTVMTLHNYRALCANGVFVREGRPCVDCLGGHRRKSLVHRCYRDSTVGTASVLGFQSHLRTAIASHVDLLVFTSELSAEILGPRLQNRKSVVLPNFVNQLNPPDSEELPVPRPYFVVVGRLTPEKGIDALLRMWPSEHRLVIVGDGPQRDELRGIATANRVEFTGFVDEKLRDQLIGQASALILPSITLEADPTVVPQALSAGTPCIVNAQTASARLASTNMAIQMFNDRASLRLALARVLQEDFSAVARNLYLSRWSPESWLQGYERHVIQPLIATPE